MTEERPLLTLGVPGTLLFLIGLGTASYVIWVFNQTRYFSIPITLIALALIFSGLLMMFAALMLYSLTRLAQRITRC